MWASQGSEPSVLKVLRSAPYKQPPSRPLRPLQDDNNDGNYADMDTVFAEMMNKLLSGQIRHTVADIQLRLQSQTLINPPETTKSDSRAL